MSKESCKCENNYDMETFIESFGKDDEKMKKCNTCENMTYENGLLTCKKFNK